MDLLGIGPLELIFILIIALVIFGPNDIVKAGKTLGKFLRKVVTSDGWRAFQQASKGMRDIPTTLMREAGLEENDLRELTGMQEIEDATRGLGNQISASTWITPPHPTADPAQTTAENLIGESAAQGAESPPDPTPEPPVDSPFSQTIDDKN